MTTPRTSCIWPEASGAAPSDDPGYWRFLEALLDGRLRLGEVVTQDRLCEVLGMSLSPLRETVTLLAAEGLVSVRRRVGITIFYPDVGFIRSSFQFRGLIEREGLRKLADHAPPDWIEATEESHRRALEMVGQAAAPTDYERDVKALEHNLHGAFVGAFGNPVIEDVHARLFRRLYLLRLLYPASVNPRATARALEEHLLIIQAVRHREVDVAVERLDRHLAAVLHRVLGM